MFDKSQIMKTAWEKYRWFRKVYAAWQIERGHVDASFSSCLRIAWRLAKKAAATAKVERVRQSAAGKQLAALERSLADVRYIPFAMNAARRETHIRQEIETLIEREAA